jgi:hypothetical protein
MQAYAGRPEPTDFLEMQGWMARIGLQKSESSIRECLNRRG